MLTNLYVLIIIMPIVQMSLCKNLNYIPHATSQPVQPLDLADKAESHKAKQVRLTIRNEANYFDTIIESSTSCGTTRKSASLAKKHSTRPDRSYHEIKQLLAKLLEQIGEMEKQKRENKPAKKPQERKEGSTKQALERQSTTPARTVCPDIGSKLKGKKKDELRRTRWGHWTDWSSCSVSCGKGRQIRWRHCVEQCEEAETEMEEKACQLPACGPGKLFGVIQLR